MREHAEMIANLNSSVPLIADADTGYGGMNLMRAQSTNVPLVCEEEALIGLPNRANNGYSYHRAVYT